MATSELKAVAHLDALMQKRHTDFQIYGNQNHHQTREITRRCRPLQSCRAGRRPALLRRPNPIEPATGNLISGDIKAQTERVLENVKAILDDQKLTFANVVKSTVFLTDLTNFAGMNEIYAKYFTENFPARSTIQVVGLPKGANVEIEVIAHF